MQPEPQATQPSWTDLSGTILPGGYELKELLEADDVAAQFRVRVLGDRELDAVAQFLCVSPAETERQVGIWELMRELRHPNLTAPLGAGSWDREGTELAYVVLRRADESLDGVLRERALTPDEAREVVASVSRGLETLHLHGLAHGCLSPEQVLAVGDSIQLPITCIRQAGSEPEVALVAPKYLAPESEDENGEDGENITPEADIWCLGATIFEALTRKDWTEGSREETGALPEPFATIALRCLEEDPETRCKLAEVVALLRGDIKPAPRVRAAAATAASAPPAPSVVPAGELAAQGAATPITDRPPVEAKNLAPAPAQTANVPVPPSVAAPRPAESKPKSAPVQSRPAEPKPAPQPTVVRGATAAAPAKSVQSQRSTNRIWIWAAVALIFVLGLVWALRPKSQPHIATVAPAPPVKGAPKAQAPARQNPVSTSGETKVLQPDGTATQPVAPQQPVAKSTPKPATKTPAPVAAPSSEVREPANPVNGNVWRVILYTYNRSADAERKAQDINSKHPDLRAEVFAPQGESGPFLVTAGAGTKEQATQLRRTALANGMPHDSYIQNFSH